MAVQAANRKSFIDELPGELLSAVAEFISPAEIAALAESSRNLRKLVNRAREGIFGTLKQNPMIAYLLNHSSIKYERSGNVTESLRDLLRRMRRIADASDLVARRQIDPIDGAIVRAIERLAPPPNPLREAVDQMSNFNTEASKITIDRLFVNSVIEEDKSLLQSFLKKSVSQSFVSSATYRKVFCYCAGKGKLELLKQLYWSLSGAINTATIVAAIKDAIEKDQAGVVRYLFGLIKYDAKDHVAHRLDLTKLFEWIFWQSPQWIPELLETNNFVSTAFSRFAGVNATQADDRGLHTMLIQAVDANRPDLIEVILNSGLPISPAIFDHAISRGHYLRTRDFDDHARDIRIDGALYGPILRHLDDSTHDRQAIINRLEARKDELYPPIHAIGELASLFAEEPAEISAAAPVAAEPVVVETVSPPAPDLQAHDEAGMRVQRITVALCLVFILGLFLHRLSDESYRANT